MSVIGTADIHLTMKPRDNYRWGLFEWLGQQKADELIIAGDLTDGKDKHPAELVNALHNELLDLSADYERIVILKGNHDYFNPDQPFFEFLGSIKGVSFITKPTFIDLSIGSCWFIPAGEQWDFEIPDVDYIFTHATFNGAKAENGTTMTGVDPKVLRGFKGSCFSGDIHVPQTVGDNIEYFGAPYHVRFGDSFIPRVLKIADNGQTSNLYYPAPKKHVFAITKPDNLLDEKASKGDHVKVRCYLWRAEYVNWRKYRNEIAEIADEHGWLLCGTEAIPVETLSSKKKVETIKTVSSEEILADYAKRHKASAEHLKVGKELLNG